MARHACVEPSYGRSMVVGTMLLNQFAADAGLMAAGVAVGGFIFHAGPALTGNPKKSCARSQWSEVCSGLSWLYL